MVIIMARVHPGESPAYERLVIFPRLLCSNADDFSINNTQFNRDAVKAGTGRRFFEKFSIKYSLHILNNLL